MSTLVVDELYPGIEFDQPFTIERDINLKHIRLWVFKTGTLQDGELTVEILQGSTLLAKSVIIYSMVNTEIPATYAHGFIRFDFDSLSLRVAEGNASEEYMARFYMDNHTKDVSNYLAVVRNYERKIYPTYGLGVVAGEAANDMVEPAGIELFEVTDASRR